MEDLSLHILDIAENSIRAGAKRLRITIEEDRPADRLRIRIEDDGVGMNKEMLAQARDPFFTTKKGKKVGLGLALLTQAAEETGGHVKVASRAAGGTVIQALFHPRHIDCKPMGDLGQTLSAIALAAPTLELRFVWKRGKRIRRFRFAPARRESGVHRLLGGGEISLLRRRIQAALSWPKPALRRRPKN